MHIISTKGIDALSLHIRDIELLQAYIATGYHVCLDKHTTIELRIGQSCSRLHQHLDIGVGLAVITAWNPRSQNCSAEMNHLRQQAFRNRLNAEDYTFYNAVGRSLTGPWSEDSLAISNITLAAAVELGNEQDQNAVVWLSKQRLPTIVLCLPFMQQMSR